MRQKPLRRPSFQPHVEALEARETPSVAGAVLLNYDGQVTTALNNEKSLVDQLSALQPRIAGDVMKDPGFPTFLSPNGTAMQDYAKAGNLYGQIKDANMQIATMLSFEQLIIFVTAGGDSFDQQIAFSLFFQFGGKQSTNQNDLSTANTTINTPVTTTLGSYPSIAATLGM
jgi:hypothetical protein